MDTFAFQVYENNAANDYVENQGVLLRQGTINNNPPESFSDVVVFTSANAGCSKIAQPGRHVALLPVPDSARSPPPPQQQPPKPDGCNVTQKWQAAADNGAIAAVFYVPGTDTATINLPGLFAGVSTPGLPPVYVLAETGAGDSLATRMRQLNVSQDAVPAGGAANRITATLRTARSGIGADIWQLTLLLVVALLGLALIASMAMHFHMWRLRRRHRDLARALADLENIAGGAMGAANGGERALVSHDMLSLLPLRQYKPPAATAASAESSRDDSDKWSIMSFFSRKSRLRTSLQAADSTDTNPSSPCAESAAKTVGPGEDEGKEPDAAVRITIPDSEDDAAPETSTADASAVTAALASPLSRSPSSSTAADPQQGTDAPSRPKSVSSTRDRPMASRRNSTTSNASGGGSTSGGEAAGDDDDDASAWIEPLNDSCAVCITDFRARDRLRELPCRHAFHPECIDPWLTRRSPLCPLCKLDVAAHLLEHHEDRLVKIAALRAEAAVPADERDSGDGGASAAGNGEGGGGAGGAGYGSAAALQAPISAGAASGSSSSESGAGVEPGARAAVAAASDRSGAASVPAAAPSRAPPHFVRHDPLAARVAAHWPRWVQWMHRTRASETQSAPAAGEAPPLADAAAAASPTPALPAPAAAAAADAAAVISPSAGAGAAPSDADVASAEEGRALAPDSAGARS